MNRIWLAGLLPLLLAAPSGRAQDSKPDDTVPASTNVQGAAVSPDPSGPAGDVPHQGAGRPEGRLRILR